MKKLLLIFTIIILSCGSESSNNVLKKIKQKIDTNGMGMIKIKTINDPQKINDSTFKTIHSFLNPIIDKDIRITNIYYFTTDLDSIKTQETIKTEMKSEGEWVKVNI